MKYSTNETKQSFQFNAHNSSINLAIRYYEFLIILWIMNKYESIGSKRRSVSRVQMTFINSALFFGNGLRSTAETASHFLIQ